MILDKERFKQLRKEAYRWKFHSENDFMYSVRGAFASECLSDALNEIERLQKLLEFQKGQE